ncbi:FAD binding domain-containing protein [Fictibacillus fluitans]|uniref:FAD binding domain-containing protein n=1 Tax=Fictibacillus fluitans TaxID=3058422 RepID=A0ABT8I101_9BACL|nr:FAD binding domain-containing protein [Fictibacillus sp. NE201]MDN4526696.1 FAD binding domain-containing protein [Fictibacillus sp. NE201]
MQTYDFDYYLPKTVEEGIRLFQQLEGEGKSPVYYSGGTEIITLGRLNLVETNAVIDIKTISECKELTVRNNRLIVGSALSLTAVEERNLFPLLSKAASGVADHTARNKITVGGNICGQIFYREAVLPFLLADSDAVIAGKNGLRKAPVHQVFNRKLMLQKGEFLVQLHTDQRYLTMPYVCVKRRQQWDTGYPLITLAVLKTKTEIRLAVSGLCSFPFRAFEMEKAIGQGGPLPDRVQEALRHVPQPVLDDVEGSSGYRMFVLEHMLEDLISRLEGNHP